MHKNIRLGHLKNVDSPCSNGSPTPGVLSPVTNLAVNLGGLSTGGEKKCFQASNHLRIYSPQIGSTPKRRISWSSVDTPVRTLSDKDISGVHNESLSDSESSFVISRPENFASLRRAALDHYPSPNNLQFQSSPVTMVQFDTSGGSPVVATKGIHYDKENVPSNLESAVERTHSYLPTSCILPNSTSYPFEEGSRDSQDSGYSGFVDNEEIYSHQSSSQCTSKKSCSLSPAKHSSTSSSVFSATSKRNSLYSLSSVFSNDSPVKELNKSIDDDGDGFANVFAFENLENKESLYKNKFSSISSLLSDPLTMNCSSDNSPTGKKFGSSRNRNENTIRSSIRRCLSMKTESNTSQRTIKDVSNTFRGIFKSPSAPKLINPASMKPAFKRPEPPKDEYHNTPAFKRRKSVNLERPGNMEMARLTRSHSETEATITRALQRSFQDPDLIGDFSRPYILPLTSCRNEGVKSVTPETVTDLIRGVYDDEIDEFAIIDCRYPYEYQGGHISGAKNIYCREDILKQFLPDDKVLASNANSKKRKVIVFHCEFSSERAPNMYRFLRNKDRNCNKECYPNLHHPELYVMKGGYKAFYEVYKEFCEPKEYKPMLHKDHEEDLKHFRAKSKSGNCEKSRVAVRPGLKF